MTQCMKEMVVANPPFLLNELFMEDSDMRCCAPEADPA